MPSRENGLRANWRTKTVACEECGNPITVGRNARKARTCLACAEARMVETMRQINAKSGPYYEKWLAGMSRYVSDPY